MLFIDPKELRDDIMYLFKLYDTYNSVLLNHFLGEQYDINLEGVSINDAQDFLDGKKTIEIVSKDGKTADIKIVNGGLDMKFYYEAQESKVLYASVLIYSGWIGARIYIQEFDNDGSMYKTFILANDSWQQFPTEIKARKILHYKLYVNINYYSADSIQKLDRQNIVEMLTNNMYFMADNGIGSEYSNIFRNESLEKFAAKNIISEFLKVKKNIEYEIKYDENNRVIQQLVKEN